MSLFFVLQPKRLNHFAPRAITVKKFVGQTRLATHAMHAIAYHGKIGNIQVDVLICFFGRTVGHEDLAQNRNDAKMLS